MRRAGFIAAIFAIAAITTAHANPMLKNGDFEAVYTMTGPSSADQGYGVWKLGADNLVPDDWSLNGALPGQLQVGSEGAASGKRFPKPVDLSPYEALALWVCGDGKGEALRFQFRDAAGANADWVIPMNFRGWRLMVFKTADAEKSNWKQTEYVLFYFNNIPAGTTVAMKFDDLKAIPKLPTPPRLCRPALTVEGNRISVAAEGKGIVLKPGPNRFELSCGEPQSAPRNVTIRVMRIRETGE